MGIAKRYVGQPLDQVPRIFVPARLLAFIDKARTTRATASKVARRKKAAARTGQGELFG